MNYVLRRNLTNKLLERKISTPLTERKMRGKVGNMLRQTLFLFCFQFSFKDLKNISGSLHFC